VSRAEDVVHCPVAAVPAPRSSYALCRFAAFVIRLTRPWLCGRWPVDHTRASRLPAAGAVVAQQA